MGYVTRLDALTRVVDTSVFAHSGTSAHLFSQECDGMDGIGRGIVLGSKEVVRR